MTEQEIITKFLNAAIKKIDEAIIETLEDMYTHGKPYDKETIEGCLLEKRLLKCYL